LKSALIRFASLNKASTSVNETWACWDCQQGLGNKGLMFEAGKLYEGYRFAKANHSVTRTVSIEDHCQASASKQQLAPQPQHGNSVSFPLTSHWTGLATDHWREPMSSQIST
jgi:hypothetical protein